MADVKARLNMAIKDAATGVITNEFVAQYIDKIFVTLTDNDTTNLKIKIFTGKNTEKWLKKLNARAKGRMGVASTSSRFLIHSVSRNILQFCAYPLTPTFTCVIINMYIVLYYPLKGDYMYTIKKFFSTEISDISDNDNKIHFTVSNERIFNIFHKIISRGTFLAMICVVLYYVYAFSAMYNGSTKFDWLLTIFSDFVEIMNFSLDENPYVVGGSSYPPIAIVILYPFALICKSVFARYAYTKLTVDELTSEVILYPEFWVAILLFFLICSVLIVLLCAKLFGIKGKENIFKLASVVLCSARQHNLLCAYTSCCLSCL